MSTLSAAQIRIVLVGTSHSGNIGAAARAMKTMGLARLYLVTPKGFPSAEATARASGADDVLGGAVVCADLASAIADCRLVVGTSARTRTLEWPLLAPREAAANIVAESQAGEVALVFGRERSGLSNEELDRCNAMLQIPSNPEFSSLNLAAAVQLMAWEINQALQGEAQAAASDEPLASADQMARFYEHFEQAMIDIEFLDPDNPKQLMRRVHRMFNRARLEDSEVKILRGILTAAQKGRTCDE